MMKLPLLGEDEMATRSPMRSSAGFTLVELLIVILIIAVLVGLLVPAIAGAVRTVNAARCSTDIQAIGTALTQFKVTYGDYPPSRIFINETGYYNPGDSTLLASIYGDQRTDITFGALNQRSVRYLQKFWARAQLFSQSDSSQRLWPIGAAYDINGNNQIDQKPFMLTGDECLAFFLGGAATYSTGSNGEQVIGMNGFSKDPSNPFNHASTSRASPIFDFKPGRLVDPDGDGFPSYLDTYGSTDVDSRSYAYFSAYASNGYDPNDCNALSSTIADPFSPIGWIDPHGSDDGYSRVFGLNFQTGVSTLTGCYPIANNACASPGPNPYTASSPVFTGGGSVVWQNAQTFQVVSAGADRLFGIGGNYTARGGGGNTLGYTDAGGLCNGLASMPTRQGEWDNLASIASGRLGN